MTLECQVKFHLVNLCPHSHPVGPPSSLGQSWQAVEWRAQKGAETDEPGGTWRWWLSLALLAGLVRAHGGGMEVTVPTSGAAEGP